MNKPDYRFIGKPIRRAEDGRLITGRGQFSDDFLLEGQTYAAIVRSPYPHARIRGIDSSRARKMKGVLGVFTGADCLADKLGPIPHDPLPKTRDDLKLHAPGGGPVFIGPHMLLPADKARHVGEAVAMVVAETRNRAMDAAEAVEVDYEELPFVIHSEDAIKPGAPAVWDELPSNMPVETWFGDRAATDKAFAAADHVVKLDMHIGRVTGVPIELRAAVANYDKASGRYTLYAGSGGAVRQKNELSQVLGIKPDDLRVLSYDVGGNFGTRNRVFVEFGLVLWASKKVGRPVKYTATRSEAFLTDYQGRDLVSKVELALRKDGKFLAMRAENISNIGARAVSFSPLSKGSGLIPGSYDIPAVTLRAVATFTHTMPTQAYRSSGRPEVTYAVERLIDNAATELGFDRVALRRKNLIKPKAMPYRNAIGMLYDSGRYEENMNWAMDIADWKGFSRRRREAKKHGKLLGLGLANYVESSIGAPKEQAQIYVRPEGRVDVVIGTQPSGQGHETSFAQCVSEWLAVPFESVKLVQGDTDIVPVGGGSHSGRSMRFASIVMGTCSNAIIARGKRIAGRMLETDPDKVEFKDGRFHSDTSQRSFDVFEIARAAQTLNDLDDDLRGPLAAESDQHFTDGGYPYGCAVCEVEIEPDTGAVEIVRYSAVDDVGRAVNPMILHGQTHGAIAQGVGQALWEHCIVDPDSGQVLTGSFMDYAMPRADGLPSFRTELMEVLSPSNPLGVRAGGEGGTTPALGAVVNAVVDALRDYGVTHMDMPLTSEKIWRAIRDGKAA
jgi:carbon-monoxide dehydrogenase large subunit